MVAATVATMNLNNIISGLKKMDQIPNGGPIANNESVHKFFNQLSKAVSGIHSKCED